MPDVLVEVLSIIKLKREQVRMLKKFVRKIGEFVDQHDLPPDYVQRYVAVPIKDFRDYRNEVDSHLEQVSAVLQDPKKVEEKLEAAYQELVAAEEMLVDLFEQGARRLIVKTIETQSAYWKTQSSRPFKDSSAASIALADLRSYVEANGILHGVNTTNVAAPSGLDVLFPHVESIAKRIERVKYKVIPAPGTTKTVVIGALIGIAGTIAILLRML